MVSNGSGGFEYLCMIALLNVGNVEYSMDMMGYLLQNYNTCFVVDVTYLHTILLGDKVACVGEVQYVANVSINAMIIFADIARNMRGTK